MHHNPFAFKINRTPQCPKRQDLRTHGTTAEAILWRLLKGKQIEETKFRRQFGVGPYILDFYAPEVRLCVELDGTPHFTVDGYEYDLRRTHYLEREHNILTLRFENKHIYNNIEEVKAKICEAIRLLRKAKGGG